MRDTRVTGCYSRINKNGLKISIAVVRSMFDTISLLKNPNNGYYTHTPDQKSNRSLARSYRNTQQTTTRKSHTQAPQKL